MLTSLPLLLALQAAPPTDLERALAVARKENQRVLVLLEEEVGQPGDALDQALSSGKLRREFLYEYQRARTSPSLSPGLAPPAGVDAELPQLLILDAQGRVLTRRDWASFGEPGSIDAGAILKFMQEHEAPPRDALQWLEQGRQRALAQKKTLFVHIGAPW